ncbi:MAG: hypothetical protein QOE08_1430 [Thermoleophilaceae bacterium]|nr:hypothetical protein [Thermoleophilaceae bacterium]
MRRAPLVLALAVLLGGPTVLAFFSGGYFGQPRLVAGIVACVLLVVGAVLSPAPLPRSLGGRLALGGLALLAVLTAVSIAWAPSATRAVADSERLLLYVAALAAAAALLRSPGALRLLEPVFGAGVLVVMLYGLSDRLLPGIVDLTASLGAVGRLEQPLSYWNATGALAATGVILWVRVAGDATRSAALRAAGAAAAVPIGLALYLSFSRGAIGAVVAGVAALFLLAPTRAQLRAIAIAFVAIGVCSAVASGLDGVRELARGGDSGQGAVMLAVLVVAMLASAAATRLFARREPSPEAAAAPLFTPGRGHLAAALLLLLLVVVVASGALHERHTVREPAAGANNQRLTSLQSTRYSYWRVAARAFAHHPVVGLGSGGFAAEWLRERDTPDAANDAHSLYVETAAELGVLGLGALALFLAGAGLSSAAAYRRAPVAATGAVAAVAAWAVHAGLDWDWEMPAVTLPALILLAALIAASERETA